jgi:hypothetical protein
MFRPMSSQKNARLIAEAATTGLAFGSVLCWASTCLVSTFRPQDLPDPYWDGIPWLRTDTSGFGAFIVAAISLAISEYLRLWRRQHAGERPATTSYAASGTAALMWLALSETVAILATGLVGYLSLNTITHPASLQIHVTHLMPWPAEGTLRVVALLLCVLSVATFRYLRGHASRSAEYTLNTEQKQYRSSHVH